MARLPDWERRAAKWLREAEARPLDWKAHHCAFLAADACRAVTGKDPARSWRSKSAARMRAQSARGVFALVPYAEIPVPRAGRFDLLGFEGEDGEALGVCLGREALAFVDGRPARVPALSAVKAWRVE